MRDGKAPNGTSDTEFAKRGENGGAIFNLGQLTLVNCRILDSRAGNGWGTPDWGGGITSLGGHGGAIYNRGTLWISDTALSGCSAGRAADGSRGYGGWLGSRAGDGGPAPAGGHGGGILNDGYLVLNRCVFNGNKSGVGGAGGEGGRGWFGDARYPWGEGYPGHAGGEGGDGGKGGNGGAVFNSIGASLVVTNCTFVENAAGSGGSGGVGGGGGEKGADGGSGFNYFPYGPGKPGGDGGRGSSGGDGGASGGSPAIHNQGAFVAHSCTVATNYAGTNGLFCFGGAGGRGGFGGIGQPGYTNGMDGRTGLNGGNGSCCATTFEDDPLGTNTYVNSIVSVVNAISGIITSSRNTLIGVDPRLAPLADNGGATMTCALLPGSPAIEAGDDTVLANLATDQRGQPRKSGAHVDIGAYELDVMTMPPPTVETLGAEVGAFVPGTSNGLATLHALVNANGLPTLSWFEFGASTNYGSTAVAAEVNGTNAVSVTGLAGVNASVTYHYRAAASNARATVVGSNQVLSVPQPFPLGDINGDGLVTQSEVNNALSNFLAGSQWLHMTNSAGLGTSNVTFEAPASPASAFTVEYSTNLSSWNVLGIASPRYQFTDTNASVGEDRYYRLRWP